MKQSGRSPISSKHVSQEFFPDKRPIKKILNGPQNKLTFITETDCRENTSVDKEQNKNQK